MHLACIFSCIACRRSETVAAGLKRKRVSVSTREKEDLALDFYFILVLFHCFALSETSQTWHDWYLASRQVNSFPFFPIRTFPRH